MGNSYLYNLYLESRAGEGALDSFTVEEPEPRTRTAIQAFEDLARQFPAAANEALGRVPAEALAEMGRVGLFGMSLPAAYGGMGLPFSQYLKVVAHIAPLDLSLALASLAHLSIGVQGILLFGTPEQKDRYLRPAAAGRMIFAYALTEPEVGSDAKHIETRAQLSADGSHYTLTGRKTYITNANYAGAFTVFARIEGHSPGHLGAFVVERDWDGVTVGDDLPKMGLKASSTAPVSFEGVRVPVGNRLGETGEGFRIAMSILNYGRLAVAAAGVGLMEQAARDMRARAASREQFGVPIARFELIQEKIARAEANGFAAANMVAFAARQLELDPLGNAAIETSHCKLFCTTRAWEALYDAQQVAGGSGYLAAPPHERRLRDWRVATVFEGTTEIHSQYPALLLLRSILDRLPRWTPARLWHLLRGGVHRLPWPSAPAHRELRRSWITARRLGRSLAFLLRLSMARYGKGLAGRQFLLRRFTWLSLYAFGLLVSAARLETDRRQGRDIEAQLDCLRYFRGEAVRHALGCWWIGPRRQERLLAAIAARGSAGEVSRPGGRGLPSRQ